MRKIEVIPFKEFMDGTWKKEKFFDLEFALIMCAVWLWCGGLMYGVKAGIDHGIIPVIGGH